MTPGKAGGLFGERLGNCSLRCSRLPAPGAVYRPHHRGRTSSADVPDAAPAQCSRIVPPSPIHGLVPPPSMESCIHAVVKGADNTVSRLKAADFILPLPPHRGGWGGGGGGCGWRG